MPNSANDIARFLPASDQSLLVYLGQEISFDAHRRVIKLLRLLAHKPIVGVHDLHPAYCSVLINFDMLKLRHDELEEILRSYLAQLEEELLPESRQIEIPVCYGGEFGPDLDDVCTTLGITPTQAIELHVSVSYIGLFFWICSWVCISRRIAKALVDTSFAVAASQRSTRQRRYCW